MTEDQQRVGEDYDFVNPQAPTFNHFFKAMGTASGGKETILFSEWHRRALEYAAALPKSSLARITTIIDGYTDENAGTLMKRGPVGKHVFGLDAYAAPFFDEEYVHKYLDCINAVKVKTTLD